MISITFRDEIKSTHSKLFFKKIIYQCLKSTGLEDQIFELSINIVDEENIRELNKKYREKDNTTDVLSFPLQTLDKPITPSNVISGTLDLGDIFISLPVAIKKAQERSITLDNELRFLVVHGFLHLLGYDHERSSKDEKIMFMLQDRILSIL